MLRQCLRKAPIESITIWKDELSKTHATKRQEEWTVDQLESPSDGQTSSDKLRSFLHVTVPQIKSRILHAASAIFPEIGRGHFVPMLTIALACLGRIHSILMQVGRECLTCLKENTVQINGDVDHLFQIDHDELVVKLNHFVNGLRWKDAVRRFRLPKGLFNDKTNVQNRFVSKSSSPNRVAKEAQFLDDDMGEVVTSSSAGLTEMYRSDYQDDLLEVKLPSRLEKSAATTSDETCRASERPKKRKRKDKKKKKSTANAMIDDNVDRNNQSSATVSDGKKNELAKEQNNDFEAVFHNTFNGDHTQRDVPISSEGKVVAKAKSANIDKKERKKKKKAKDIDAIFDETYGVPTQKQDSSNVLKKRKATKKRSSIIDDIFS